MAINSGYHRVRIETRNVGVHFAVRGVVVDAASGEELGGTRDFPYGYDVQARAAAEALVADRRAQGHNWEPA